MDKDYLYKRVISLLIGISIFYFAIIYLPQKNEQGSDNVIFQKQLDCIELGKKTYYITDTDRQLSEITKTTTDYDFYYSKKQKTCIVIAKTTNWENLDTRYSMVDMFSKELIASYNKACEAEGDSYGNKLIKCTKTLDEFNSKK
jgi:predicted ATP-dependent endonuclease of OLD family